MSNRYRFDEWLNVTQNSELCAEEILSSIRSRVRIWTEKELNNRDTPHYYNFIREYPEYIHDGWKQTIEEEMKRTVEAVASEKRGRVPRVSQTIKIISNALGIR